MAYPLKPNYRQTIFEKLAGDDPFLQSGVKMLLNGVIPFKVLNRASVLLGRAKKDSGLVAVEGCLQSAISEVRSLRARQVNYLTEKRTARYLAVLQGLIFRLPQWEFPDGHKSSYQPQVWQDYQDLRQRAKAEGVDPRWVRRNCFVSYRVPGDPDLDDFELLDESQVKSLTANWRQVAPLADPAETAESETEATPEPTPEPATAVPTDNVALLDKLIKIMRQKMGDQALDFLYLVNNLDGFLATLGTIVHTQQREVLAPLAEAMMQRITKTTQAAKEHWHNFGINVSVTLEKLTDTLKQRLGVAALRLRYLVDNLESFFLTMGDVVHVLDQQVLRRLTAAVLQHEAELQPGKLTTCILTPARVTTATVGLNR